MGKKGEIKMKKKIIVEETAKHLITTGKLKDGGVLFISIVAGVAAFRAGCRAFERIYPEIIDKIEVTKMAARTLGGSDEDFDYDDYDFDDD